MGNCMEEGCKKVKENGVQSTGEGGLSMFGAEVLQF